MNPPIPAVGGDTGSDLDHPADEPLDGSLDLLARHIELMEQVQ